MVLAPAAMALAISPDAAQGGCRDHGASTDAAQRQVGQAARYRHGGKATQAQQQGGDQRTRAGEMDRAAVEAVEGAGDGGIFLDEMPQHGALRLGLKHQFGNSPPMAV